MSVKKSDDSAHSRLVEGEQNNTTELKANDKRPDGSGLYDDTAGVSVVLTEKRSHKRLIIGIVAGVVILAGSLTAWALWPNDAAKTKATVVGTEKYQQSRAETEKLRGTQDYDGAKKVWQDYINGNYSDEEKYKAYLQIASLDETKGDCKAALQSYYAAEKIGKGEWRAENEAIGRCSEKLGDLPTALKYYQRTLDTFPGGEAYNSDITYYKNKISKLKKAIEESQNG